MCKSASRWVCSILPTLLIVIIVLAAMPFPIRAASFVYSVRFQGITYTGSRFEERRSVTPDDLGPVVGRVTCDIVDLYSPSASSAERMKQCAEQEGGASMLPVGTPVYRMRDYRPEYRLAAYTGYQWMIFHVSKNARAKVGADLLDVEAKVRAVAFKLEDYRTPRKSLSVRLEAESDVGTIVSMVRAALVFYAAPANLGSLPYRYWITVWFKDGTAHELAYFPDIGWLSPGLQLTPEFRRLVEDHLPPPVGNAQSPSPKSP